MMAKESSRSFEGLGRVVSAAGGGIGFLEADMALPALARLCGLDADDPGLGPHWPFEAADPGRRGGPRLPGMLIPPTEPAWGRLGPPLGPGNREPDGGGVMARRATGWAYGMTNELVSGS